MAAHRRKEDIKIDEEFDYSSMALLNMEDYDKYNRWARKQGRPVKVPDENSPIHKKVRIKFQRIDQPENVLKSRLRTREIDWRGQLKPGKTYDLPMAVVRFLNRLAVPVFEEVRVNEGDTRTETRQTGERNRFMCQVLDFV